MWEAGCAPGSVGITAAHKGVCTLAPAWAAATWALHSICCFTQLLICVFTLFITPDGWKQVNLGNCLVGTCHSRMRHWQIHAGTVSNCGEKLAERFGITVRPTLHLELIVDVYYSWSLVVSLNGLALFCCSGASYWLFSQRRNASIDSKKLGCWRADLVAHASHWDCKCFWF